MIKPEDIGTSKVGIYKIKCNISNRTVFIHANNNEIQKVIFNKKHAKKETIIKEILSNNNYDVILLKLIYTTDKEQIKDQVIFWRDNEDLINKEINKQRIDNEIKQIHINQYNLDYYKGILAEDRNKTIIELAFKDTLIKTKNRYSPVDFIGNSFLYEIKSFEFKFGKYPYAIIGTNKLISENLICIFEFGEHDLHYIKADFKLFETFEKKYIKKKNRLFQNEVYIIPNKYLMKIVKGRIYKPIIINSDFETEIKSKIIKDGDKIVVK